MRRSLQKKAEEFDDVITMGRTQLQDAVPIRLGQVFHGYASMVSRDRKRIEKAHREMYTVNLGGTAVGTAINVSDSYFYKIVPNLEKLTGYPLKQAEDLFDATENLDGFVAVSGVVKTCAVDLSKMCNDLRLMSSGPKTGFGEINLPAKQNGSSIMPGKVNPVIPEVVSQVAFHIVGHDTTITMAAEAGQLELNAFEPVVFCNLFESITTLEKAVDTLIVKLYHRNHRKPQTLQRPDGKQCRNRNGSLPAYWLQGVCNHRKNCSKNWQVCPGTCSGTRDHD